MRKFINLLLVLSLGFCAALPANAQTSGATEPGPIIAVDILLEPDATMLGHAEANNARLLKAFSQGFALDAAHRPHVTLLQFFMRTEDLEKVYAATEKVVAGVKGASMQMEAFKYYYVPAKGIGLAGIVAKPTAPVLKLQRDLIAAVSPFVVATGPIGAFTASHGDAATDTMLIDYVSSFVPKHTGEHFMPHVTTGVAPKEHLDQMLAEPFAPFSFASTGAAVYQLGPFGTAAKKLKAWDLKS